jgi:2-amino-4-hydroxy-6-hydroxymethyldihydropteridine diphosphokinase
MTDERVFIGLGSNQGERRENLERGLDAVGRLPDTSVVRASEFHWTPPWGLREQPWFLNAAAELRSGLDPLPLMSSLLDIEKELGRVRLVRYGPRTLDLDILLFGDRVLDGPDLVVPHPLMATRRFVLAPLAEIAPEAVHPVSGLSVRRMLENLGPESADAQFKETASGPA